MRDRRGGDFAAPGILADHRDAIVQQEVAHPPGFREAAEVRDLQAHDLGRTVGGDALRHAHPGDALVELHRLFDAPPRLQAFFVRAAWLLHDVVDAAGRPRDPDRLVHAPALVGVGQRLLARMQCRRGGLDAFDVGTPVRADLDLELAIAALPQRVHFTRHLRRRLLRCGPVQRRPLGQLAAEQHPHRLARRLAQKIPAGRVERRLGVAVAAHDVIHQALDASELARVLAEQGRRQQPRRRFDAFAVRFHVVFAAGAEFAGSGQAGVGVDDDDGGAGGFDDVAAPPGVCAAGVAQGFPVNGDPGDAHDRCSVWPVRRHGGTAVGLMPAPAVAHDPGPRDPERDSGRSPGSHDALDSRPRSIDDCRCRYGASRSAASARTGGAGRRPRGARAPALVLPGEAVALPYVGPEPPPPASLPCANRVGSGATASWLVS